MNHPSQSFRHRAVWLLTILTASLASCSPQPLQSADPTQAAAQAPQSSQPAQDCTFLDAQGQKHRLSEFKGKVIVLTEFAYWCPHCQAQLPKIQSDVDQVYGSKGVVCVNVEATGGSAADVVNFAKQFNVTMALFRDDGDSTVKAFPVNGFPTTYFITPAFMTVGSVNGEVPTSTYITAIKPYLGS